MFGISVHPGREIEARFAQASSINWPITHRCIMERGWETTYLLFQLEISRGKETSAPKSHSEKKKKTVSKCFVRALREGRKKSYIIIWMGSGQSCNGLWWYVMIITIPIFAWNILPQTTVHHEQSGAIDWTQAREGYTISYCFFLRQDGHSCVWDRQKSRRMGG